MVGFCLFDVLVHDDIGDVCVHDDVGDACVHDDVGDVDDDDGCSGGVRGPRGTIPLQGWETIPLQEWRKLRR